MFDNAPWLPYDRLVTPLTAKHLFCRLASLRLVSQINADLAMQ
jgi:hypothetical protein